MLAKRLGAFFQKTSPNKACLQTAYTFLSLALPTERIATKRVPNDRLTDDRPKGFVTLLPIPIVTEGGAPILLPIFWRSCHIRPPPSKDRPPNRIMTYPHPRVTRSIPKSPHQETEACSVTSPSFDAFVENPATLLQPLRQGLESETPQGQWMRTTS